MLGENVTAAGLALLAIALRRVVVRADVFRALGYPQRIGLPERKGIDGAGRPTAAGFAVAITHRHRVADDGEPDSATKARSVVGVFISHDASPGCRESVSSELHESRLLLQARLAQEIAPITRVHVHAQG